MSESEYWKRFSAWLIKERSKCGLSRERLGVLVGVHRNTIQDWEKKPGGCNAYHYMKLREVLKSVQPKSNS